MKELDDRFDEVQTRAYNTMCYQAVKVYVCGRITPKKLLQQPPAGGAAWPPEKELLASNLYSAGESVLLAWASAHYLNRFPNSYNRVRNFDDAFRSGLVIISLLVDHWPALEDRLQELRKNPAEQAQWPNNAKLVLSMWNGLKLPYELKESDLLEARPINTLMLMLYLFQALPQLLPLTSIEFNGKLNETQVRRPAFQRATQVPSAGAHSMTRRLCLAGQDHRADKSHEEAHGLQRPLGGHKRVLYRRVDCKAGSKHLPPVPCVANACRQPPERGKADIVLEA